MMILKDEMGILALSRSRNFSQTRLNNIFFKLVQLTNFIQCDFLEYFNVMISIISCKELSFSCHSHYFFGLVGRNTLYLTCDNVYRILNKLNWRGLILNSQIHYQQKRPCHDI